MDNLLVNDRKIRANAEGDLVQGTLEQSPSFETTTAVLLQKIHTGVWGSPPRVRFDGRGDDMQYSARWCLNSRSIEVYMKGHYTEGAELIDCVLDVVRKVVITSRVSSCATLSVAARLRYGSAFDLELVSGAWLAVVRRVTVHGLGDGRWSRDQRFQRFRDRQTTRQVTRRRRQRDPKRVCSDWTFHPPWFEEDDLAERAQYD